MPTIETDSITSLKHRAQYCGGATFELVAAGNADTVVISATMIYELLKQ